MSSSAPCRPSERRGDTLREPEPKENRTERPVGVTLPLLFPPPPLHSSSSPSSSSHSSSSPSSSSSTRVGRPPSTQVPVLRTASSDRSPSTVELPRLRPQVGPGKPRGGRKRTDQLTSSDVPIKDIPSSLTETDKPIAVSRCVNQTVRKVNRPSRFPHVPLTGIEVVQIFLQKPCPGDVEFYYLQEVKGPTYRPYDLQVVDQSEAGSDHYVFSSTTVLHASDSSCEALITLSEWYRECVLWTALQRVSFYRDFRARKAFTWWRKNVRALIFQRKCWNLQDRILMSVPQLRDGIHRIMSAIQDLLCFHWMPMDECGTYTLVDFKDALAIKSQSCRLLLEELAGTLRLILRSVRDECHQTHRNLQQLRRVAEKPSRPHEPIHLLLAHQRRLKKELLESERTLLKLGRFSALSHHMVLQGVGTFIQQDVLRLLSVLKGVKSQQCCLFLTELCFNSDSELTVEPPTRLFEQTLSRVLHSISGSIIQMCHTSGLFEEVGTCLCVSAQDRSRDVSSASANTGDERDTMSVQGPVLTVQGQRIHGCYAPLSQQRLEWQLSVDDVTRRAVTEHAEIMEEVELETHRVCQGFSWLVDIHVFVTGWRETSLSIPADRPGPVYTDLIQKLRNWKERVRAVDSTVSTSKPVLTISCTNLKEALGSELQRMEEQLVEQLTVQARLLTQRMVSELEAARARLAEDPDGPHHFTTYTLMVRESTKTLPETQSQRELIQSLISSMTATCGKMTEQQLALSQQMQSSWEEFSQLLIHCNSHVSHRLPSLTDALDKDFEGLVCEFENVVSDAASQEFLDPGQDAGDVVNRLRSMCGCLDGFYSKLQQLSATRGELQGCSTDLTVWRRDFHKVSARRELWELRAQLSVWSEEWKQMLFTEASVSQAQLKIAAWKTQTEALTDNIPPADAVLKETFKVLQTFSHQLVVMAKLLRSTLKEKHWEAVFEDAGQEFTSETNLSVADVMSLQLQRNQDRIDKVCHDARRERNMEQSFQQLRLRWRERVFLLQECSPCPRAAEMTQQWNETRGPTGPEPQGDARHTVIGLESCVADVEGDLMTLSIMLNSPYSTDFRQQLNTWIKILRELEAVLGLFGNYQQMWSFLRTVVRGQSLCSQRKDWLLHFSPVDKTFQEIMHWTLADPHVLNFVSVKSTGSLFEGGRLYQVLSDGLSDMEGISNQMTEALDSLCKTYPRLFLLGEREVMELLSLCPTPSRLEHFVRKCFREVRFLDAEHGTESSAEDTDCQSRKLMRVLGVFGSLQEHVSFCSPLESPLDPLLWFGEFEKHLKLTTVQLMKQTITGGKTLDCQQQESTCDEKSPKNASSISEKSQKARCELDRLRGFPLQCVVVAEELRWSGILQEAFKDPTSVTVRNVSVDNSAKLNTLCHLLRNEFTGSEKQTQYEAGRLRALVQLTMNHAQQLSQLQELQELQGDLEASFQWQRLLKYGIQSDPRHTDSSSLSCWIDAAGQHFHYGFEYCGPEDLVLVQTPTTDQAVLGILLALSSFRWGFVSGAGATEQRNTALQLGKALGRHNVAIECCQSMTAGSVVRVLLGALHAQAWLVFHSVDSLTPTVLSVLGQHLLQIHTSLTCHRQAAQDEGALSERSGSNWTLEPACQHVSSSPYFGCVLISSITCPSSLPGSLRLATRPVALAHPDYQIHAEVKLTSVGFSDAKSLSQRLVSLINRASVSPTLPDFVTKHQSGYVGVLNKILAATECHFQQMAGQRFCSHPQSLNSHVSEDAPTASGQNGSHLSVIWSLMEETAVVKAIISVLIPLLDDADVFYNLFKDTFPIACQLYPFQQFGDGAEKRLQIEEALVEELQGKQLHHDKEIIRNAHALYQCLVSSLAVILIGPSGSGKTTCYSLLTAALNSATAKATGVLESATLIKDEPSPRKTLISVSDSPFYSTQVLFPNSMSHEEMFGSFCEERGWQDGVVGKLLRASQQHEYPACQSHISLPEANGAPMVRLLVLDGEPWENLSWLDPFTTLCNPQDPFLSLSSGETLRAPANFKLLVETTHLRDASPCAVTSCGLVYLTGGEDLWRSVWKGELAAVTKNHKLDHSVTNMWRCLGEDLFSSTLCLVKEKVSHNPLQSKMDSSEKVFYGVQEITSFVRIFSALLQYFQDEVQISWTENRDKLQQEVHTPGTRSQSQQQLLTRDIFLVSYIWGFGGHLEDGCWPQFDSVVRHVLFTSRYKISVPDDKNVFEHFFSIETKIRPKNIMLTTSITPKFGKYIKLLNIMLKTKQPVLVAGQTGCGKTTVCNTLLTDNKLHISLPLCSLQSSTNLRTLLTNISDTQASTKQHGLLLFLDDLHEATCHQIGTTSAARETLRQSISKQEIIILDKHRLRFLDSNSVSYLATCSIPGLSRVLSPRLSRLFSIFLLPGLSVDVIFSMHSGRLTSWLTKLPSKCNKEELSRCIVTATKHLYDTIHNIVQPTMRESHFLLSHQDIHRVLCAMCLSDTSDTPSIPKTEMFQSPSPPVLSGPSTSVLNVAHLWAHECARTFCDRLCTAGERERVESLIAKTAVTYFADVLVDQSDNDSSDGSHSLTSLSSHSLPTDTLHTCQNSSSVTESQEKHVAHPADTKKCCSRSGSKCSEGLSPRTSPLTLQCVTDAMTQHAFAPQLSLAFLDKQHVSENRSFHQKQEVDAVGEQLRALLSRKAENTGQQLGTDFCSTWTYVVHRQGVRQLLHVFRALLTFGGHGVLIGSGSGTGRKTTVRLAARLSGYQLVEIHPGNEKEIHQILKEVGYQTTVDGDKVILLVHQEISPWVRDEILVAMSQGSYPAVHTDQELAVLVGRATAAKNSRSLKDIWRFEMFLFQAHRNVHVFLLMPSVACENPDSKKAPTTALQAQIAKSARLSCCVEVYHQWSRQSLVEVAAQRLKLHPHVRGWEASLSAAMAGIHQSSCHYASGLLSRQPFSPQSYMELTAHFGHFCILLHRNLQRKARRVDSVLSHLEDLENTAAQCKACLGTLQRKMEDTLQQEKELLKAADDQRKLFEEWCARCGAYEQKLCELEEKIGRAQETVKPVCQAALELLRSLSPSDLEEVRHYREPPDGVVKVMEALCVMFHRPPGWESAKQLLGQSSFFQELEYFDRWSLTKDQLQQLQQLVVSPQMVPETVRETSKACESLCRWIQAVCQCCSQHQRLLPQQQWAAEAREARAHLNQARVQRQRTVSRLEDTGLQLCSVQQDLKEQLLQLREAEGAEREASWTTTQTQFHLRRWRASAQEAASWIGKIPGDALILAAVTSYLGPFPPDARAELITKWTELCRTGSIDLHPTDPRADLFPPPAPQSPSTGFPLPLTDRLLLPVSHALEVNEWTLSDTSQDRLLLRLLLWSSSNLCSHRWPLLADAQTHRESRSMNWLLTGQEVEVEEETQSDVVLRADEADILDELHDAAERGLRVLLTEVERLVPSPELLRTLLRCPMDCSPGRQRPPRAVHPRFRLFLCTNLPVRFLSNEIHPSILARVQVFDLSLSAEEMPELMLTQVLQSECRELLIQQQRLQNYNQSLQQKVFTEEEALMDYFLHPPTPLLEGPDYGARAAACQEAVEQLGAQLTCVRRGMEAQHSLLAAARRLMRLAASLYQALQDVSQLCPLYYFSLRGFVAVLEQAFCRKEQALLSEAGQRHVAPLITTLMVEQLVERYRPGLFKHHVRELQLHVSLALLQHAQRCTATERSLLLRGLSDLEPPWPQTGGVPGPGPPSWMCPHTHSELLWLERMPPFTGLIASISASSHQWLDYLRLPTSAVMGNVPVRSHSHLTLVQRALLCRVAVPGRQEEVVDAVNTCVLPQFGRKGGGDVPPAGLPKAVAQHVFKHQAPAIVIMADPNWKDWSSLEPLHCISQLVDWTPGAEQVQIRVLSLGQIHDRQVVMSSLEECVCPGSWLVFDDCHLIQRWDDAVVSKLSEVINLVKAAVLMSSIPVVCEASFGH